jgi:hypothetical protein
MKCFGGNTKADEAGINWEAHCGKFTLKIEQDFEDLMDWEDGLRYFLRFLEFPIGFQNPGRFPKL